MSLAQLDFITPQHRRTRRDYIQRVASGDKARWAALAKTFGKDYWDGDRRAGYGGFRYDGRWRTTARRIIDHYGLKAGDRVLDVGGGKGFLLADLCEALPGLKGVLADISGYALKAAPPILSSVRVRASAAALPFASQSFDLVLSINTLHNLYVYELKSVLQEISRVSRGDAFVCVESYRNEQEKDNLLNWQLTCESFFTPKEWVWIFREFGYSGDYEFIFFE